MKGCRNMTVENLAKDEFIGLPVKIKECKDPNWKDKKGVIIDETKNTFLIQTNNNQKRRIAKNLAVFEFKYKDKQVKIDGSKICYRPEDRVKKC